MALEPTMIPAASLIVPTRTFAAPATRTVTRVDAVPAMAASLSPITDLSSLPARRGTNLDHPAAAGS
jgi:hypothetical protein